MITSKLFDKRDYKDARYADIKRYFEGLWNVLQIEGIKFTYSSEHRAWEYGQVINSIPDWKMKTVLDLGTSVSLVPIYLHRVKWSRVTTMDMEWHDERWQLYEDMIPMFRDVDSGTQEVDVDLGDMTKPLQYRDGQFDIVTSFSVIEHLPNVEVAIAEMKRVCKKGGYIAITTDVAPKKPQTEKSGYTFTVDELMELHRKFGLPVMGEMDYANVNINDPAELAVDGKYTFASLVMRNV